MDSSSSHRDPTATPSTGCAMPTTTSPRRRLVSIDRRPALGEQAVDLLADDQEHVGGLGAFGNERRDPSERGLLRADTFEGLARVGVLDRGREQSGELSELRFGHRRLRRERCEPLQQHSEARVALAWLDFAAMCRSRHPRSPDRRAAQFNLKRADQGISRREAQAWRARCSSRAAMSTADVGSTGPAWRSAVASTGGPSGSRSAARAAGTRSSSAGRPSWAGRGHGAFLSGPGSWAPVRGDRG